VALDRGCGREVGVAERLRRCTEVGNTAEVGCERVAGAVHVQSARHAGTHEPRRLRVPIPPSDAPSARSCAGPCASPGTGWKSAGSGVRSRSGRGSSRYASISRTSRPRKGMTRLSGPFRTLSPAAVPRSTSCRRMPVSSLRRRYDDLLGTAGRRGTLDRSDEEDRDRAARFRPCRPARLR
jgi:hypothetical protein